MSTLPIYLYGNEVLKKKTKKVTDISDDDIKLIGDMFETMRGYGIGLAANQVGIPKQILVIDISDSEDGKETKPLVVINPEIIDEEGDLEFEEGCLSIPDVREKVWRPEKITVRFNDINMKDVKLTTEGLLARVLQHEIDHLNGVLFIERLNATKRTLLKSKLKKVLKGEVETQYEVVVAPKEKPKTKKKK